MIIDILLDALIDSVKVLPFLLIAFIIIEYVEHKMSNKNKKALTKAGKAGPVIGGLFGAIPQCGFSALATNLYVTRIITLGTLISVYLSTSDEMIIVLLSENVPIIEVLKIVLIKVVIGMVMGFIIDLIYRKSKNKKEDYHLCDDDHCDCEHSVFKSAVIHTIKTFVYILIASFIIGFLFELVGEENLSKLFLKDNIFAPFVAALIGLIPNCGASVALTEFYLSGVISLGTAIGGLLTGAGIGLIILFKQNKNIKENLTIMLLIYSIGSIFGILLNLFGV